jgi:hypothetical protein
MEDFSMLSRRSILIATLIATAAGGAPAFAAETQTYDPASFAAAEKAGKPILVAVHASWCPTCKAQKPILSELMADCQRRSKNASVSRSKNTSVMLARRPPNWGSFRQASSLGGIVHRHIRAGTA